MKKRTLPRPSRFHKTVLWQVCQLIPSHLVAQLARACGADRRERTFSCWSQVVAMVYAQVAHALSLNDVCDALRLQSGALSAIRGARPPAKNTLSHANKVRDHRLAEQLFWHMLEHLQKIAPGFGQGRRGRGLAHRFRASIQIVDATVIGLVASCLDWARHRRRKAAAKCHLRLDLQSFLPRMAIVDAGTADATRAAEMCAQLQAGEIVIFDKAYVDFPHLWQLQQRGVFWVSRCLERLRFKVIEHRAPAKDPRIKRDVLIAPLTYHTRRNYPGPLRLVEAEVEIDGRRQMMSFLTNNLSWAASSVAELYRCRWQIEIFFKQLKQTVQLADFLGHSANAVKWQVWTALLVNMLMRFLAWRSQWAHSFGRLFTFVRAALWLRVDLQKLLKRCGTAEGDIRCIGQPAQAWLPGWTHWPVGQHA
jgi:hypothetical protein